MANSLPSVLIRFRKEDIAITADIEAMYYQVMVPESQRLYLRFLWWPDGDTRHDVTVYEMCVHRFGAVSSGSCAYFALKKTASDAAGADPKVLKTIDQDFYVDDTLT